MINDGQNWHYLAVKKLRAFFTEITSKHVADFYCLNCFHSYSTEKNFKNHYEVCEDHDCFVEMPKENNKILKYIEKRLWKFHLLFMLT